MRDIRISVPKAVRRGEVIELKAMIRHAMESGYRRDEKGEPVPRLILEKFECLLDDTRVFYAEFGPGIAAQPLTVFYMHTEHSGILIFRWTEQTGEIFEKTAELTLS